MATPANLKDGNSDIKRNWKLLEDPVLKKGHAKLYRFDGITQGSRNAHYNLLHVSDPRTHIPRFYARSEPTDLRVPAFKIDDNYVGCLPKREVSFFGLNDNINRDFLADLCKKCGEIDDVRIFYDPKSERHLGLAFVIFKTVRGAKNCLDKYNRSSVMGKTIEVMLDTLGKKVKGVYRQLIGPRERPGNTTPTGSGTLSRTGSTEVLNPSVQAQKTATPSGAGTLPAAASTEVQVQQQQPTLSTPIHVPTPPPPPIVPDDPLIIENVPVIPPFVRPNYAIRDGSSINYTTFSLPSGPVTTGSGTGPGYDYPSPALFPGSSRNIVGEPQLPNWSTSELFPQDLTSHSGGFWPPQAVICDIKPQQMVVEHNKQPISTDAPGFSSERNRNDMLRKREWSRDWSKNSRPYPSRTRDHISSRDRASFGEEGIIHGATKSSAYDDFRDQIQAMFDSVELKGIFHKL